MSAHKAREKPNAVQTGLYEFVPINFALDNDGDITWEEVNQGEASLVGALRSYLS